MDMVIMNLWEAFFSNPKTDTQAGTLPDDVQEIKVSAKIKERIVPEKFRADVEALKNYVGESAFKPNSVITLKLSELLTIIPRERKRSDAYKSLVEYLAQEQRIVLNILSRKKNYEEKQ